MSGPARRLAWLANAGPLAAGASVVLCGIYAPTPSLLSRETALPLGYFLVFGGIILLLYALAHPIEKHLRPEAPAFQKSLRMGPYAVIRQPVALAIITAFAGSALTRQTAWGLLAAVFLFAPLMLFRAHVQERALAARFGERWEEYAVVTGFILPFTFRTNKPDKPA